MTSLYDYMVSRGYTSKPKPRVILNTKVQEGEPWCWSTGHYDPTDMSVTVFVNGRAEKDVLRSFAHELIHHKQNVDGRLGDGAYSGTEITEDNKLVKLEEEAYLKGNIAFRSWTEELKKKQGC